MPNRTGRHERELLHTECVYVLRRHSKEDVTTIVTEGLDLRTRASDVLEKLRVRERERTLCGGLWMLWTRMVSWCCRG